MGIAVIGVVLVFAAVLFFIMRSSPGFLAAGATSAKRVSAGRAAAGAGARAKRSPYRAVSVRCGAGACEEALALGSRRFLHGRLGQLPLEGCNSPQCNCTFEHHADRRSSDDDQRAPIGLRSELYAASGKPERRKRRGRRKSDFQ